MAGQEKIHEKNPEISTFSCVTDWNKLQTFNFFPRLEHVHITLVHAAKFQTPISSRHFSETQETKAPVVSDSTNCWILDFPEQESVSHSLTSTRYSIPDLRSFLKNVQYVHKGFLF